MVICVRYIIYDAESCFWFVSCNNCNILSLVLRKTFRVSRITAVCLAGENYFLDRLYPVSLISRMRSHLHCKGRCIKDHAFAPNRHNTFNNSSLTRWDWSCSKQFFPQYPIQLWLWILKYFNLFQICVWFFFCKM